MPFEDAESSSAKTTIGVGLIGSIITISMNIVNPLVMIALMANGPPQDFMTSLAIITILFAIVATITNILLGIGFYGLSQRYQQILFAIGGIILAFSVLVVLFTSMMIPLVGYGILIINDVVGIIVALILFVPLMYIRERSASSNATLLAAIGFLLSIVGYISHWFVGGPEGMISPMFVITAPIALFSQVTILLFFYTEWRKLPSGASDLPDTW
ncbi:MAG: hypothetical protein K9W43_01220 [Candidatus Thorarchaeota archaeon]|nr:hypothetical protein [Candidatus Thorarchaeota archaeon]